MVNSSDTISFVIYLMAHGVRISDVILAIGQGVNGLNW